MTERIDRREFLRRVGLGAGATVLASCIPQTGQPGPTASAGASAEPLTLPIVKQPLSLSYWAPMSSNVSPTMKSFGEIACYRELEKRTGIHIEFQHPPLGQETEQFNLVAASGKYPDVIEYHWLTNAPGGPARFLRDGVIVRLNDLLDRYAPNLKRVLGEHPEWRKMIVTDDGDIYAFPFIRSDPLLLVSAGLAVRQDWLDKLSLKMPTTLDDWRGMLAAVRQRDPNGDGKTDELPLSTWAATAGGGTGRAGPVAPDPFHRGAGERPQPGARDNPYPGQGSAAITISNKNVVETVKMLDYAYSPEGSLLFNFGIEGTSYTIVNGVPTYVDAVMHDPKIPSAQMISRFARGNFNGPFIQDVRYITQYYELPEQKEALKVWTQPTNEKLLPPLTVTQDESKRFASIMADITTRYDEVFNRVWSGKAGLDEWDGFVRGLRGMSIDDALKIQQAALDRYNKRPS